MHRLTAAVMLELLRATGTSAPASEHDPSFVGDRQLRELARAPGDAVHEPGARERGDPADGGPSDARWLWAAALLALAAEWRLRRAAEANA